MEEKLKLTCFSDLLCIWAYIAQARLDEVRKNFPDSVEIEHRFCPVFGDTRHKIGKGWADRGGYAGFGDHALEVADRFEHISVHPQLWKHNPPASSTPAHLAVKAVQRVSPQQTEELIHQLRDRFFVQCEDISQRPVLEDVMGEISIDVSAVRECLANGIAHADLEADRREQQANLVSGSPTILLNEGRQKLYGNVGYTVIEANIRELLRSPESGAASWC